MAGIGFPNDAFQRLHAQLGESLEPTGLAALCNLCGRPAHTLTTVAIWPAMAEAVLRRAELDRWLGELLTCSLQTVPS
jgi:hypothetical protein